MNRRSFVSSVLALAAVRNVPVVAQTSTSTPEPKYLSDFVSLRGVKHAVYRYAEASSIGLDVTLRGDLLWLTTLGFEFDTETHANAAHSELASAYQQWASVSQGWKVAGFSEAAARSLGDQSWGYVAQITGAGDRDRTLPWALFAVRKKATVQITDGMAGSGNPIRRLADISEKTLDRWPNDDRVRTLGGIRVGGLWDTLPRLEDLEEGMVIEESFDVSDEF